MLFTKAWKTMCLNTVTRSPKSAALWDILPPQGTHTSASLCSVTLQQMISSSIKNNRPNVGTSSPRQKNQKCFVQHFTLGNSWHLRSFYLFYQVLLIVQARNLNLLVCWPVAMTSLRCWNLSQSKRTAWAVLALAPLSLRERRARPRLTSLPGLLCPGELGTFTLHPPAKFVWGVIFMHWIPRNQR